MASAYRFVNKWTPERFTYWAASIHEDVKLYRSKVLDRTQHRELDLRDAPDETDHLKMPFHDNIPGEH